jgi:hypothetical protein
MGCRYLVKKDQEALLYLLDRNFLMGDTGGKLHFFIQALQNKKTKRDCA